MGFWTVLVELLVRLLVDSLLVVPPSRLFHEHSSGFLCASSWLSAPVMARTAGAKDS
jgi:hypothetical protein